MGERQQGTEAVGKGVPNLPPYAERSLEHRRSTADEPGVATVFSDAAGLRRIRAWTEVSPLGLPLYRESDLPPSSESAHVEAGPLVIPAGSTAPSPESMEGGRAAAEMLCRHLALAGVRVDAAAGGEGIIECVRASADASVVRRVWRLVGRVRVFDPSCDEGDWLWGVLQLLGAVGIACLERMRGWVGDAAETPPRRRSMADFRRLIMRWDEMAREGCRDRLAFERVLSGCLYGMDVRPWKVAWCRRMLAETLGSHLVGSDATVDETFVDVREGWLSSDMPTWADVNGSKRMGKRAGEVGVPQWIPGWGEAVLLDRAAIQLRHQRLALHADPEDVARGWREIEWRRSDLRRLHRIHFAVAEGEEAPLDPWLEYPVILAQGGFHLVRGAAGDGDTTGRDNRG